MALTVEIVSHDTVKPCSPTPPSLRNYKLSHMDQLCRYIYSPILLFYSNTITTAAATDHHRFKKALAETLTHMYPFAGRVKHDGMSIDCNDDGAEYIVTRINESMSTVLENPSKHFLQQLLPFNISSLSYGIAGQPLLALQINQFSCSGVVIGACIGHAIADGSAAAAFLRMWAAISYGDHQMYVSDKVGCDNFIFRGRTTLYPPFENNVVETFDSIYKEHSYEESNVSKLLVFDGPKVAALKEKVGAMQNPTRVQAVMAFIWAALISTSQDRNQELEMHWMSTAVNIRNKMEPPLPAYSLGNVFYFTAAACNVAGDRTKIEMDELVQELKKSIDMVTEDFIRKEHGDPDQFLKNFMSGPDILAAENNKVEAYSISSWCRFPYYEIDFGWGKPVWVATLAAENHMGILLDTSDGAGIQAWLNVRSQDMEKLEKDPDFLAYVSAIYTL